MRSVIALGFIALTLAGCSDDGPRSTKSVGSTTSVATGPTSAKATTTSAAPEAATTTVAPATTLAPTTAPASTTPAGTVPSGTQPVDTAHGRGGGDVPTLPPTTPAPAPTDPPATEPPATEPPATPPPTAAPPPPATTSNPRCPVRPHDPATTAGCGDTGALVTQVQQLMQCTNFAGIGIDGQFGPATYNAVRAFQQEQGLPVDGLAGPTTISYLQDACAAGDY